MEGPRRTSQDGESSEPLPNVTGEHVVKCAKKSSVRLGYVRLGLVWLSLVWHG